MNEVKLPSIGRAKKLSDEASVDAEHQLEALVFDAAGIARLWPVYSIMAPQRLTPCSLRPRPRLHASLSHYSCRGCHLLVHTLLLRSPPQAPQLQMPHSTALAGEAGANFLRPTPSR